MKNPREILKKLNLLKIKGFRYIKPLGGGSSLSSLYIKQGELVVFKFLIAPRNKTEIERFKLECSVLELNQANSFRDRDKFIPDVRKFIGPQTSYPLPKVKFPLESILSDQVHFFAYHYEDGQLLSEIDTKSFDIKQKIFLLYRIASGLNYLNQTGYSHRDLHPGNILIKNDCHMPDSNRRSSEVNDPRVKFLDMGNCQRIEIEHDWLYRIPRNLDEDLVFEDNNRRVLASFTSMPPDFLKNGENTLNYDSWSFGIYAYQLFFEEIPFETRGISDISALLDERELSTNFKNNLEHLPLGLRKILACLLAPTGDKRPSIHSIVRLFSWLVDREEEFNDSDFIDKVIKNDGFDPYYDPRDDYY